jgi:hypothetical protein
VADYVLGELPGVIPVDRYLGRNMANKAR